MEQKKNRNMNKGAVILTLLFILLFLFAISRFGYVGYTQQVKGVPIKDYASDVWTKAATIDAKRGTILDKNGEVIAEDIPSYTVQAILDDTYPNHVKDVEKTVQQLAPLIDMPKDKMTELLSKDRFQVEFGSYGRKLSHSTMTEIKSLKLGGIVFVEETKRYYPNQIFASHVIGFTTEKENGEREGIMGLESTLNKYLQESDGEVTYQSDKDGFKLPDPNEVITKPKNGYNVHLTIDEKIQLFLEQEMSKVQKKYKPKRMVVIVADPKTGQILAMGSKPSFNPNLRDIEDYTNYAISSPFEPGSTMKIFTLAAAIEEGVYNGSGQYQSGSYTYNNIDKPIHDHNGKGWGTITFDEGVRQSSNVAFSIIAKEQLGYDRLGTYLFDKFMLGKKTGIDLPNEAEGIKQFQWESEKITTAFGQGTAVTPIQQIQAATAIANDGKMMKPYVINKIVNPDTQEVVVDHKSEVIGTPVSSQTAKQVRDLLRSVVTDGTGKSYDIDGYDVAGKTGTAEVVGENGKYMNGWDDYIFSFLGMAPKDDPKLLVYVAIDQPNLNDEDYEPGSSPVSQIFNSVMKNSLQYLSIEPSESVDQNKLEQTIKLSDYKDKSVGTTKKELLENGLTPIILGSGKKVINQVPKSGENILKAEQVFLLSEGNIAMPDLLGWSKIEVLRLAEVIGLDNVSTTGNGFVTNQSIPKGETVNDSSNLVIKLSPPGQEEKPSAAELTE
jgi:penicillin-binding protein 2B